MKLDINKYIASGILEQYVLGNLSPKEQREVEEYAQNFPEIKEELNAIGKALEKYALLHKVEPQSATLDNILNKIAQVESPKTFPFWPLAATMLFILAAILAFIFIPGNKELRRERDRLQQELQILQADCDETESQLQLQLDILRDPANRSIFMNGTELAPGAIATVHWNEQKKIAYLDVINLPAPAPGQQYQLWAIVDGKPVDMGVFDVKIDSDTFVDVPFIENPQAFAVTLEPQGGSEEPTLENMFVIGNV